VSHELVRLRWRAYRPRKRVYQAKCNIYHNISGIAVHSTINLHLQAGLHLRPGIYNGTRGVRSETCLQTDFERGPDDCGMEEHVTFNLFSFWLELSVCGYWLWSSAVEIIFPVKSTELKKKTLARLLMNFPIPLMGPNPLQWPEELEESNSHHFLLFP
jgi:hypothetical protein